MVAFLANSIVIKRRVLSVEKCDITLRKTKHMFCNCHNIKNQEDLKAGGSIMASFPSFPPTCIRNFQAIYL